MARILIVDDDGSIRDVLRAALEDEGFTVEDTPDPNQALELMEDSTAPLVVLLDLNLSRNHEYPVLKGLKSDPSLAQRHRVLIMSASQGDQVEEVEHSLPGMVSGHILKPFDLWLLIDSVARLAGTLGSEGSAVHPN